MQVQSNARYVKQIGFKSVTYRKFAGGHNLSSKNELTAAVKWWLGK